MVEEATKTQSKTAPRGATRRTWVKFFVTGWLHGSIRWQLEPDERGVWADLIVLAGECNKDGKICDNDFKAYPRKFLANQLNVTEQLLGQTIVKCIADNRLEDKEGVLIITNWNTYQSEYARQKKYRGGNGHQPLDDDPNKYIGGKLGHMVNR